MTKRVRKLADSVATRRGFLGGVGKLAGGAAAGLACLLVTNSAAAKPGGYPGRYRCVYLCEDGKVIHKKSKDGYCDEGIETRKHGICRAIGDAGRAPGRPCPRTGPRGSEGKESSGRGRARQ